MQRNNNYLMHRDYKYVKKLWRNGRWRYYYDDDSKRDKGFSYKKIHKGQVETNVALTTSTGKGYRYDIKDYYVSVGKDSPLFDQKNIVDEETYNHSKSGLYYKNELVSDIVKYGYKDFVKSSSKKIEKGKEIVGSLISKIENLRKKS